MLLILYSAGLRVMLVRGRSMQPALGDGSLIISCTVKDLSDLGHDDVIIFHPAPDSQIAYVKRVIGLPGDVIEAQSNLLFLNGTSDGIFRMGTGTWGPITIDDDCVFVMGDNRAVSIDSRTIGCIPFQQICAKVVWKSSLLS